MLDQIIVLGLIPGTQFQITFDIWLVLLITSTLLISLRRGYKSQSLQRLVVTSSIILATRRRLQQA